MGKKVWIRLSQLRVQMKFCISTRIYTVFLHSNSVKLDEIHKTLAPSSEHLLKKMPFMGC